eukprot:434301-Prymnesium_polylepis.1
MGACESCPRTGRARLPESVTDTYHGRWLTPSKTGYPAGRRIQSASVCVRSVRMPWPPESAHFPESRTALHPPSLATWSLRDLRGFDRE